MKTNKLFYINLLMLMTFCLIINGEGDVDSDDKTDRFVKISGDGSVYDLVKKNVTQDGGKSYRIVEEYEKVPNDMSKKHSSQPSAKLGEFGAIVTDDSRHKIYRLRNEEYFIYDIIDSKSLRRISESLKISKSAQNFPTGLTAAVSIGKGYYLLFRKHQFCRRKLYDSQNECPTGFKENSLMFRCLNAELQSHKDLCKNVNIDGAALFNEKLFVFKGDKHWIFINSTTENPGYYDSGNLVTSQRFKGFVPNNDGITSYEASKFLMIKDGKMWLWASAGPVLVNGSKIVEPNVSIKKYNKIHMRSLGKNAIEMPIDENSKIESELSAENTEPKAEEKVEGIADEIVEPKTEPKSEEIPEPKTEQTSDNKPNDSKNQIRYPSNKDGVYGAVIQLDNSSDPRFARLRGREIYYFRKNGDVFEFDKKGLPIVENQQKLPPDIQAAFRGPDDLYYFIREEFYCRRPLDVSGVGLDPPDFCPEGGDLRELLGCNIRFYPPDVEDLCNNPIIDNTLESLDGKSIYLFRDTTYWNLTGLPLNATHTPHKCILNVGGDATKIWSEFGSQSDALFVIKKGENQGQLTQFSGGKFKIWDIKGGAPIETGLIKQNPVITKQKEKIEIVTEKPAVTTTEKILEKESIIYDRIEFKELCMDPVIDAADSSLNGSEVYIYKGPRMYILTGLRDNPTGKLVDTVLSKVIYDGFDLNSIKDSAIMTAKEGYRRGHIFHFFGQTFKSSWDEQKRLIIPREPFQEMAPLGLSAVLHNRNLTDPLVIGLQDEDVYYYSSVGKKFSRKRRAVKYYESKENFPPKVTAAFSMPNEMVYLFRDNQYCVRELYYNRLPPYCPKWRDSRELFGCFGEIPREDNPEVMGNKMSHQLEALDDLCSNVTISDADRLWQREDQIYVWRGQRFWKFDNFPKKPILSESGSTLISWPGFSIEPDAVAIIQEGPLRRGWFFAFFDGHWSAWYPDKKPWVGYKLWWGQPIGTLRFGAMIHNGDLKNPLVYGFSGKYVYYYKTDESQLRHIGAKNVINTEELWPENISAGFRMEDNTLYLFKGNTYCKRNWICMNSSNNCCPEWKSNKELFGCKPDQKPPEKKPKRKRKLNTD